MNWRVNISRIRRATAFISSVILRLYSSNVFSKVCAWTRNSIKMLLLRKKAKFEFSLTVNISSTTTATASKSRVILLVQFSNILWKSGVWSANTVKMLKVKIKAKFDFNLRINISRIRTATALISSVILRLYFSNVFSKCGAWTRNSIEMLILRTKAKFEFSLTVNISSTTTVTVPKSCVILRF